MARVSPFRIRLASERPRNELLHLTPPVVPPHRSRRIHPGRTERFDERYDALCRSRPRLPDSLTDSNNAVPTRVATGQPLFHAFKAM